MEPLAIYIDDLTEEAKEKVLKYFGLETPEEGNLDVFPLVILEAELQEKGERK
jgi:hypothetical protein